MNAERLLQHYEQIADAPGAITRMRRFILDLAVRGKLVAQDPNDEPASELLKRIAKEKARLEIADRRRASPNSRETAFDELDLPNGWAAVQGFEIFPTRSGNSKLIKGALHSAPADGLFPGYSAAGQDVWLGDWEHEGDAIILSAVGARCGKAFLATGKWSAVANTHIVWLLKAVTVPAFAMLHLNNEDFWVRSGGAQPFIKVKETLERTFPLPPLAEQHRIVAKVDELMGLCDRLEAAREARETTRNRLTAASLARLNAPDPETFQADARFVLDALPALTTRPDQVKALRQTILNLAVRGKLVPQDANDEPASELLKRIAPDASDRKSDAEYELPTIWAWALIDDCFAISGGMQKTPARVPKANAFPYLGVGNVYRGRLDLANVKKFELAAGELDRFRLLPQDILVVEGNGSASEIGRCAVWNGEIEDCVHQNHIIRCRPKALELTAYAALYLNSPDGMAEMKRLAITSAGLFSLSVGKIRKIPFPLPPLAEQHRIVAKVDALMALCDRLEASLTANAATRRHLLDALLAEALLPVNEPKFEEAV